MMSQAAGNKNPDLSKMAAAAAAASGMVLPPGFAFAPGMANFAVAAPPAVGAAAIGGGVAEGAKAADIKKDGVAKAKAPRKKWKKPADKPKRPLSAYNLFFAAERKRIISEMDAAGQLDKDAVAASSAVDEDATSTDPKRRPHRKTSGVGFRTLAQKISERWKNLDAKTKAPFEKEAAKEKEKYLVVLAAWKEKKAKEDLQEKAVQVKLQEEQARMRQIQHEQIREQQAALAAAGATFPALGAAAAAPALLVVPPGLTPQQQQQYMASLSLAGIAIPPANAAHFAPKAMSNIGVPNTSLYAMAKPVNPAIDGQQKNAVITTGNAASTNNANASHPGIPVPRVQPELQQPSSLQQQQQAPLTTTTPGATETTGGGVIPTTGVNGTSQVDWESMRTVVNQSDPTSMAAAAINAASGGDENPIDAINRAQAFLSNLKASLETGPSAEV